MWPRDPHLVLSDTAQADALALLAGVCHKGGVRRLRDFEGIAAFLSEREIEEMQAAIDARREDRAARGDTSQDGSPTQAAVAGSETPEGWRRAG